MDLDDFYGLQVLLYRQRDPRVMGNRCNPMVVMSNKKFKKHFRFNKIKVQRIADLLEQDLKHPSNQGSPLTPVQQVCIALNHMAGGHYQRVSGVCGGVCQWTARSALVRVTNALLKLKSDYIHMPSSAQMQETSLRMLDKFGLPRFAFAVDGCQVKFIEAPRKLPANKHAQLFWCRKQFYSLNVQIVGNDELIYDIDCRWPGSTHDARVWNRSEVKKFVEAQRAFYIAGDTGYPISDTLIKPYTTAEAGQDRSKRVFNRKLSGLRTVMSECLYGVLKRKFPILKNLRTEFQLSQKIVVCTAILFNMSRLWLDQDEGGDDGEEDSGDSEEDSDSESEDSVDNSDMESDNEEEEEEYEIQEGNPSTIRLRGQAERDILRNNIRM